MGRLISFAMASLDGYVADADGRFDWAVPDAAVHRLANEIDRRAGTHLMGRRMYEVMSAWEDMDVSGQPDHIAEFQASWRDTDKVVYSRSLAATSTARTRLEREFEPKRARKLVDASERDVSIAGPTLAGQALVAGIVDELHLVVVPVLVGGGLRALPDGARIDLELRDERRFETGAVYLRYDVTRTPRRPH